MVASDFRALARNRMKNSPFSQPWLMMLAVMMIYSLIIGFVSYFGLAFIIAGPMAVGISAVTLRLVRDNVAEVQIEEMFVGFKDGRFVKTFLIGLLEMLYLILWALLIIPVFIKIYSYSMAYYIHLDNPNLDADDCITESRRLMDGHKWRLFCLDLSFIGWILLSILTFGLLSFWIAPYQQMAHAYFYEDLIVRRKADVTTQQSV